MGIMTIGIDLTKNVFAVNGVDQNREAALIKSNVAQSTGATSLCVARENQCETDPNQCCAAE